MATQIAKTIRKKEPEGKTGEKTLYVDFLFFKVDSKFRRLEGPQKEKAVQAFREVMAKPVSDLRIRPYLTLGFRAEVDFLLWAISEELENVQTFVKSLYQTEFGKYLSLIYSFVALKKPSPYALPHQQAFEKEDPAKKFLFVYPFVKSREWYLLPFEKRKAMMDEHFRIGHQFPSVRLNTTYAFGLGDQDFVLAFEADRPVDFENLVQRLRETEGSRYTVRDTPMIVGTAQTLDGLIEELGL